ncbi:efflux RND transporter permease subunit [Spartinivicinus poritis]|uniref:MMPL family transporter n=1 Tax=Spartinivicinus poritis TaxID=2994640 RepID=A0ABT5U565_9GAMM|nr:MMPL family transporter [Spartinivicinus sp. A2-2]MDE1461499.1 MMPL family transporter [Spartinivicinus sp. A2-2]
MMQQLINTLLVRPWFTLLVCLLLIIAASYGNGLLTFRGDYKVFFSKDNPQLVEFESMQKEFNKTENMTIVLAPDTDDVFTKSTLALIKEITEEAWQTPYSSRVDSLTNYQYTYAKGDDLIVEDLVFETVDLNQTKLEQIKQVAINEPDLVNRLISRTGHVAVVNITVQLPERDKTAETLEVTQFVKKLTAKYKEKYPDISFYNSGILFIDYSFAKEAQLDAELIIPLMFVVILIMLGWLLKSIASTLATLVLITVTIAVTMGLAGWAGFALNTATVNVPTLVMTLAVADCVHITSSVVFAMRQGQSKLAAINHSLTVNLKPVFLTSATTALGFLSMNFSDADTLQELGNLTALGVVIAFAFSVTLLPALLLLLPMKVKQREYIDNNMNQLADWVILHHRKILPLSLLSVIIFGGLITLNTVSDDAVSYFAEGTEFRRSADFLEENLSGMSYADFSIDSGTAGGVNEPAFLQVVEKFSHWLRQQPEVDHVFTISDTLKRLNKNMHGDDPVWYKLPETRNLVAQYILLYEMSLPYGLDLNNQLNIDKSATRVACTIKNIGSKEFIAFENRAKQWIRNNAPELKVTAASPSLMFAHIGEQNMDSMLQGTFIALLSISFVLIIALRSWRLGLISLVSNVLPALIGFGCWALYSGQINLGLSVVSSMSLGIIVDDTVHFLSKYKLAKGLGKSKEDAIRYAFVNVGRALWITTLVLVIGFGVLVLSSFQLNADMGLLTSVILVIALLIDFIFLPAYLLIFDKQNVLQQVPEAAISH